MERKHWESKKVERGENEMRSDRCIWSWMGNGEPKGPILELKGLREEGGESPMSQEAGHWGWGGVWWEGGLLLKVVEAHKHWCGQISMTVDNWMDLGEPRDRGQAYEGVRSGWWACGTLGRKPLMSDRKGRSVCITLAFLIPGTKHLTQIIDGKWQFILAHSFMAWEDCGSWGSSVYGFENCHVW